jgi:hypothetical protein
MLASRLQLKIAGEEQFITQEQAGETNIGYIVQMYVV